LSVHQEHLYTEVVQDVLRQAIRALPEAGAEVRPRVLLTTLPGESHGLGLLMAEALLALEGAVCVSLGVQTPLDELARAAGVYRADIVALSATACQPGRSLGQMVQSVRSQLPPDVALWLGGSATQTRRNWPAGCTVVSQLSDIAAQVQQWRRLHTA
jgi:methanogenic corrinoid protein MtbC1